MNSQDLASTITVCVLIIAIAAVLISSHINERKR